MIRCIRTDITNPDSDLPGDVSDDETIAAERIAVLAERAREAAQAGHPDRARDYVKRARRIAQRQRIALPRAFDRFTCDRCDAYLLPGRNARVRTRDGHVVVTCDCGEQARYPYADGGEP